MTAPGGTWWKVGAKPTFLLIKPNTTKAPVPTYKTNQIINKLTYISFVKLLFLCLGGKYLCVYLTFVHTKSLVLVGLIEF